jgi:hypothetical protein
MLDTTPFSAPTLICAPTVSPGHRRTLLIVLGPGRSAPGTERAYLQLLDLTDLDQCR